MYLKYCYSLCKYQKQSTSPSEKPRYLYFYYLDSKKKIIFNFCLKFSCYVFLITCDVNSISCDVNSLSFQ